jgi:gliding motility-associated-like protein
VDIGNDTAFCKGDEIHIPLDVTNSHASYLWQPSGSTSPVYVIEEAGVYSVEVSNACTSVKKEITIDEIDCSFDFKIPNIFTPNGDGINELFAPEFIPLENLGDFQMYVYDRWGRMVFSTESYQTLWDGANSHGKPYAEGVYYYYLYFTHKILKDREYKYQGTVTLIRN